MSKHTRIVFSREARAELLHGLSLASGAITCTLGPGGKTVLIASEDGQGAPLVTKDGVTVANAIVLKNSLHRQGAELVKEASRKTNEVAGDGTTTAALLTHALAREAVKLLDSRAQARDVVTGYEQAHSDVREQLLKMVREAVSEVELERVAHVSSNGDALLAKFIAQAVHRVGSAGIVQLEETKSAQTSLEYVDGVLFDRGYVSPYFVNDASKMVSCHKDALVFLTNKKLSNLKEVVPLLEWALKQKKPLLIIADEFDNEALQSLVVNHVKGVKIPLCAVVAPGQGRTRTELLNDIAALTGCKIFGVSKDLKDIDPDIGFLEGDLGHASSFTVDAKKTVIVGDPAFSESLRAHAAELFTRLQDPEVDSREGADLKVRLARLSGGLAVLRVGGSTEIEMRERKHRAEDALCSARAALAGGVLPGGGEALRRAALACADVPSKIENQSVVLAYRAFLSACKVPLRKIAENCEVSPDLVEHNITARVREGETPEQMFGYNARTGEVIDLWLSQVYDPALVTFSALENAVSVARAFASLGACVVEDDDADDGVRVKT